MVKQIQVTPVATYPVLVRVDNISLASTPNTFDVYLFDGDPGSGTHGNQVAETFYWSFKGI